MVFNTFINKKHGNEMLRYLIDVSGIEMEGGIN